MSSDHTTTRISVRGERPYDVTIGRGLLRSIPGAVRDDARQVAVVHPGAMEPSAKILRDALTEYGYLVTLIGIPDGEGAKTSDVAADCWSRLGKAAFTRSDVIIGVGGGATTDLAGFVAATWLRGVNVIHIPTTLLAMVDAAVGGKTGINTAEGKNLVGSFHEPSGVFCDLDFLATLPDADLVAGLAEVIKVGFTSDPTIIELIEADPAAAADPHSQLIGELIQRAIAVKATVVANDRRESSSTGIGREVLNYGHTFAHAIEQVENYTWRHGDAVSVGIMFEAHLANVAGLLSSEVVNRQRSILHSVGLPTSYSSASIEDLIEVMKVDKKSRGDLLRFVVIDGVGQPRILAGPTHEQLSSAYDVLGRDGE